jgi:hypothetical protein
MQTHESLQPSVQGFIKITDISDSNNPVVLVDKKNAIHYENMSEALASSLSNRGSNYIYEMHFGNGGTSVDPTGIINYLPPNVNTQNADLYSPTYSKVVDDTSENNTDPVRNKMEVRHIPGTVYSDILVTCLLDYGEPAGQTAFDNNATTTDLFAFDELGLKGWSASGAGTGKLLTHVIFHPVQKSLNRLIQIEYTVRIQSLTNLTGAA